MSRIQLVLIFLCLTLFTACAADGESETENKALFIIVDGISADVLETVDTPNLDAIAEAGSYSRAWIGGEAGGYSESPTVSAVGYNHLLTGTWSNKHNVWDNSIDEPNYNYWNLFRLLKHNDPDRQAAIYSSWLDNRTKLAGDGLAEAGGITIDIHYDGFEHDTLAFPHQDEGLHVQDIDRHVSERAAESILSEAPDLSWVYLWYPDTAGHLHGDGDIYYESLRKADRQVGRIWEAIRHREETTNEKWLIAITTDHGRRLPDGRGHGGHTERERTTWIVTNAPDTNRYFSDSQPAVVDLYPTIARFLDLDIPEPLARELDGVPLIGDISISHPQARLNRESGSLHLSWEAWQDHGDVNILLSRTNEFGRGGVDEFKLLDSVPVSSGEVVLELDGEQAEFMKIVLEAPLNTVNRWIVDDPESVRASAQ